MPDQLVLYTGDARDRAIDTIRKHHYTHSVPSGKSYYLGYGSAIVVWSIPANKNIAKFVLKQPGTAWELSRLYAPDEHPPNLLTQAISHAVRFIKGRERPDFLVSYADPNVGHHGGVYLAASWIRHGKCDRTRMYKKGDQTAARRAFHSGRRCLTKAEIEAMGWVEVYQEGKHRYVKPISRTAKKQIVR